MAVDESALVGATLESSTNQLRAQGFSSKSAWLTSSAFPGFSWLAHASLQSGLWVNSQQRHDQLMSTDRLTLSRAFANAGWRTVAVVPANRYDWPEGSTFYGYDTVYDARTLGYAGPDSATPRCRTSTPSRPLDRLELERPDRRPVMAEVDLVTSHVPGPLPRLVDWASIGDGSVYWSMAGKAPTQDSVWQTKDGCARPMRSPSPTRSRAWCRPRQHARRQPRGPPARRPPADHHGLRRRREPRRAGQPHQPDRSVMDRISGWGWGDGLRPTPEAPVRRMDQLRDRFLTAADRTMNRRPPALVVRGCVRPRRSRARDREAGMEGESPRPCDSSVRPRCSVSAAVHLYLWFDGVRNQSVGPMFLVNVVAGVVIAVMLVRWRHWLPAFLTLGFGAATLGAFIISATVGLLGVHTEWAGGLSGPLRSRRWCIVVGATLLLQYVRPSRRVTEPDQVPSRAVDAARHGARRPARRVMPSMHCAACSRIPARTTSAWSASPAARSGDGGRHQDVSRRTRLSGALHAPTRRVELSEHCGIRPMFQVAAALTSARSPAWANCGHRQARDVGPTVDPWWSWRADTRAVIESGRLAHFVTANADGSPHVRSLRVGPTAATSWSAS